MTQTTSPNGVALIKSFEQCVLTAYPDPGSPLADECTRRGLLLTAYGQVPGWQNMRGTPWTIGWGHTGPDVFPGKAQSQEVADSELAWDIRKLAEEPVNELVTVPVNQNQFDALVSLTFNIGRGDADPETPEVGLEGSTLLKYLNQGKFQLAAAEFLKWNKSGGVIRGGLVRRRKAERDLFLTPVQPA